MTVVPGGPGAGRADAAWSPSTSIRPASGASGGRETTDIRLTDASDARASPRKPSVAIASRSAVVSILLVACGATAIASSSKAIPATVVRHADQVASATLDLDFDPRRPRHRSRFSTSSLTTLAGRSTTSPAAIWFTTSGGRTWMATRPF